MKMIQPLMVISLALSASAFANYTVTIQEPSESRAYQKPMQNIDIYATVSPKLEPTDSFVIYLNDEVVANNAAKASVPTSELLPNQYEIRAEVQDETGRTVASASQVIYVIQNTAVARANREAERKKREKQLYDELSWYKKLHLNLRQDVVIPE